MTDWSASGIRRLELDLHREKRLTEASYALHTTLDLDELLQMILKAACEGVQADRGTVFVLSQDAKEIWSKVVSGDERLEIRLPLGKGIAGTVAQSGKTINIPEAYEDERFDPSWDQASGYRTQQILCQPIRSREGRITGVFQLLNKRTGTFDESDQVFLDALSIHAALALENAQLHQSALEQERQEREILLVQNVQRAYQPERTAVEMGSFLGAGVNLLCEDASGDYYDFIPLPDGRHAVVIGDVSGHGLGSALVMAQARAFLRAFFSTLDALADIVDRLDACLAQDLSAGRFMSLFVVILDPAADAVVWSNAGHPPALLLRAADGSIETLDPTGRVLGVLPEPSHRTGPTTALLPGDVLLLYTDGATEACDPEGEMFGDDRLTDLLRAAATDEPAFLLERVHAALCAWTGQDRMRDDLTMIAVKRAATG